MCTKPMDRREGRPPRPYALQAGGIDFTVKVGELGQGRRLAILEYETRSGEEPGDHTHPTEDEVFYVLQGDVTFRCRDETFDTREGGFVGDFEQSSELRGSPPA